MHFVKHPHLRPSKFTPPDHRAATRAAEAQRIFVLYGAICVGIAVIFLYGLLDSSN
jgi:hypothetical protein